MYSNIQHLLSRLWFMNYLPRQAKLLKIVFILPVVNGIFLVASCAYLAPVDPAFLYYLPTVEMRSGIDTDYQRALSICRQAAINGRLTQNQRSELLVVSGLLGNSAYIATEFALLAHVLKDAGYHVSANRYARVGATVGLFDGIYGSSSTSFESEVINRANPRKRALLKCINVAGRNGELWKATKS